MNWYTANTTKPVGRHGPKATHLTAKGHSLTQLNVSSSPGRMTMTIYKYRTIITEFWVPCVVDIIWCMHFQCAPPNPAPELFCLQYSISQDYLKDNTFLCWPLSQPSITFQLCWQSPWTTANCYVNEIEKSLRILQTSLKSYSITFWLDVSTRLCSALSKIRNKWTSYIKQVFFVSMYICHLVIIITSNLL